MSALLDRPQRHAVTAGEYLRMGEAGVFAPEARLELIDGEIIEMARIGSPHAAIVKILNRLLVRLVGERAIVSVQDPVVATERSVPQPDIALLKPRADGYYSAHPGAADVLLLVEVSDTTLAFDLDTKIPLYARAGIAEVWVIDVNARSVRVHRDPGAGVYASTFVVQGDKSVAPLALSEARIALSDIFPV